MNMNNNAAKKRQQRMTTMAHNRRPAQPKQQQTISKKNENAPRQQQQQKEQEKRQQLSSLEAAVSANQKVQLGIVQELKRLTTIQNKNRRRSAELLLQLKKCWEDRDKQNTESQIINRISTQVPKESSIKAYFTNSISSNDKNKDNDNNNGGNNDDGNHTGNQMMAKTTKAKKRGRGGGDGLPWTTRAKRSRWKYDPSRAWKRPFFIDPSDSTPKPNDDIEQRQQLVQSTFFSHTQPPWSNDEKVALTDIVSRQVATTTNNDNNNCIVDYDKVAKELSTATKSIRLPTALERTAQECQIQHRNSKSKKPLTKEESLYIIEQVHSYKGQPIDWGKISQDLSTRQQQQQSSSGTERTAWQCFKAYQSQLKRQPNCDWTLEQDQFLFQYVVAMGPQFELDLQSAAHISAHYLRDKTPTQIVKRGNASLLNPNFKRELWSLDEERKLCLLMKIYKNSPSPLNKAAKHIPTRSATSIAAKWNRSLDPDHAWRPFTDQEDKIIVQAVRKGLGWADIAKRHFPDRPPQRVYNRWMEIASTKDVLQKVADGIILGGLKKGLAQRVDSGNNNEKDIGGDERDDNKSANALFSTNDFSFQLLESKDDTAQNNDNQKN